MRPSLFILPDHVPQRAPRLRVEARRRLVEEDELGIVHEGQGHRQALLLSARERHVVGVGLVDELHEVEQLPRVPAPRVVAAVEVQRLTGRDLVEQARALELDAEARADLPAVVAQVEAEDLDLALVRLGQSLDHLQGGGLAGAVGAEEAEDLAPLDVEVQAVDGQHVRVALAQAAHAQRQIGHVNLLGES